MVQSKFSFKSVYPILFFLIVFFVVGIFLPFMIVDEQHTNAVIVGFLAVAGSGLLGYFILRKLVVVRVFPDRLELKSLFLRQTLSKDKIVSIDLFARESVGFLSNNQPTNTILIKSERAEAVILSDHLYRNAPALKRALQEYYPTTSAAGASGPVAGAGGIPPDEEEQAEEFAGNAVLSSNGIIFFIMLFVVIFLLRSVPARGQDHRWVAAAMILVPFYIFMGLGLYYFKVSVNALFVRNHFFPWYRRVYRIDEISGAVLEHPYKKSNALRVNCRNFFSKRFGAASLRGETWKALQAKLESAGIPVSNELKG